MPVQIRVRDFQSLGDLTIEVDGLTMITGGNNLGKSAIMRALRAAFQNARGTNFIRHGASKSIVDIDFGDGHSLTWEKGRGKGDKPTYLVDKGSPLHPGQGVPDEVRALGVKPIMAGGREVWPQFAPQFTGQVFLLDQPGSVMAEAVADVERVGQLNDALRMAATDKRSATAELQTRRDDVGRLEEELHRFDGLDTAAETVSVVEEVFGLVQRMSSVMDALVNLRARHVSATRSVHRLEGIEAISVPSPDAITELVKAQQEIRDLGLIRERHIRSTQRVQALQGIEDVKAEVDTTSTEKVLSTLTMVVGLRDKLTSAQEGVDGLERDVLSLERDEARATEALLEVVGNLGQCPVCGSSVASEGDPSCPQSSGSPC